MCTFSSFDTLPEFIVNLIRQGCLDRRAVGAAPFWRKPGLITGRSNRHDIGGVIRGGSMNVESVFPGFPPPESAQAPMVYVERKLTWEYKHLVFSLTGGGLPAEDTLNKMGAEGWELAGILTYSRFAHFYFKRPVYRP
jgi:hypothetical protein